MCIFIGRTPGMFYGGCMPFMPYMSMPFGGFMPGYYSWNSPMSMFAYGAGYCLADRLARGITGMIHKHK